MKKLKCCGCKKYFDKDTLLPINGSNFHNIDCAVQYANNKGKKLFAKKEKKDHIEAKKRLKDNDRKFQIKKTQTIFNSYIRLRDDTLPCVSCLRFHDGQYHAGHYRSVGANPELRFDPRNCHKQCAPCNDHLSGNLVNYRINLVAKHGVEFVDFLEGPHKPKRYTIPELKELQQHYKQLIKELEKEQ